MTTRSAHSNSIADVTAHVLQRLVVELEGDFAFICVHQPDAPAFDGVISKTEDVADYQQLCEIVRVVVPDLLHSDEPLYLDSATLDSTAYRAGVLVPIVTLERTTAFLCLFATSSHMRAPAVNDYSLEILRALVENAHRQQRLATERALAETMHAVVRCKSPQEVVDALLDHLLPATVINCSIMFYKPLNPAYREGPFDYFEVVGTWTRKAGRVFGVGTRLCVEIDVMPLIDVLEARGYLLSSDPLLEKLPRDLLVQSLMQAQDVRSWVIFALHTDQRKLGLLFLGTDSPDGFPVTELEAYHTISRYIALMAFAHVLQAEQTSGSYGRDALLNAVKDSIVIVHSGINGPRTIMANERFFELFNFPREKIYGSSLTEMLSQMQIPVPVREILDRTWQSFPFSDPNTQHGEFQMVTGEGQPADIQWYSSPVLDPGNKQVLARLYTFNDVTSERAATRIRSAFLSRVSHELRTPLTSISGFAQFILEESGDDLPDLAREYVEIIQSSAGRLKRIFSDMIDITRAYAGEIKLDLREAHLPDIVIEVIASQELQYKHRHQTVVIDVDDDMPPVYVDADRIFQVLSNIFQNAIKYTPDAGEIRVEAHTVPGPEVFPCEEIPVGLEIPCALVCVSDSGNGLGATEVEQIFEPFYRSAAAKANQVEGAGLGLAVSRGIIDLHRGHLWAVPSTDEHPGALFVFTLPFAD